MTEIHQNSDDIDILYEEAAKAHPEMENLLERASSLAGGEVNMPSLKGRTRAMQKINQDYEGDASRIKDILRGTIIVDTLEDVRKVERFLEYYGTPIGEVKDRFKKPLSRGYRNITRIMQASNGHKAEVQIHLLRFYNLEKQTHAHYEKIRELTDRLGEKGDLYLIEKIADKTRRLEEEMGKMAYSGDPAMLKEIRITASKIDDLQKDLGGKQNLNDIGLVANSLTHLREHVDNLGASSEVQMAGRIHEDIDELERLMGDIGQKADIRLIKEIRSESNAIRALYDKASLDYNNEVENNSNPNAERLIIMDKGIAASKQPSNIASIGSKNPKIPEKSQFKRQPHK